MLFGARTRDLVGLFVSSSMTIYLELIIIVIIELFEVSKCVNILKFVGDKS